MTDEQLPEIEMSAPRRRLVARPALACAVATLLVVAGIALTRNGDAEPTPVASRGYGETTTTTGLDLLTELEVPTSVPVTVPRVTVPKVVTSVLAPRTTLPRVPVVCPTYPAARTLAAKGVYSVPADAGPVKKLMEWEDERAPQSIDLSPDGLHLLITRLNVADTEQKHITTLSIANADGSGERQLFADRRMPGNAHWSPDGRMFAFRDSLPGDPYTIGTYVVDRLTLATTLVGTNGQSVGFYSWSPDSKHLAWGELAAPGIFVGSVDGTPMQRFGESGPAVIDVAFSPDSKQFVATSQGASAMLYSFDGTAPRDLHVLGRWVEWSRVARQHLVVDSVLVDPDTGDSRGLDGGGLHGMFADGSHIVTQDITGVHFVTLDGCRHTIVSGSGNDIAERDWSDDGRQLIAIRFS